MAAPPSAKGFELYIERPYGQGVPFRFMQIDRGFKERAYLYHRQSFLDGLMGLLDGAPSFQSAGMTFAQNTGPGGSGISLEMSNAPNRRFGPWGDHILRAIAQVYREDLEPDGPGWLHVPQKAVDQLCERLGGDLLGPLDEMPQILRRQHKFELLREYCWSLDADALWANKYGWGWEKTGVDHRSGKEVYAVLRHHPVSGLICISERHGRRWRRPFSLYYPEEESQAVAHVRSLA